jgi:hypothetical protein
VNDAALAAIVMQTSTEIGRQAEPLIHCGQENRATIGTGGGVIEGDVQRSAEQVWKQNGLSCGFGHEKAFLPSRIWWCNADSSSSEGFSLFYLCVVRE